jgi:hypothetical protein
MERSERELDENRDPLTGAPGAHPVGVGVGAASGAAIGAAVGMAGGPIGAGIGTVVGGVAGGLAGKGAAEAVNPTLEDAYWRENYKSRPYVAEDETYDVHRDAYRYGWEACEANRGRRYEEVEPDLAREWERRSGGAGRTWEQAREAVRDGWHRVEERLPGDADRDGR